MPYYVAAPERETGDVIARTPLYARLPTYAPTRTRIFFGFTSNAFLQRPVSSKYWLLHPFSTRKQHAKAVQSKDYFMHLRTLKSTRKGCWVIALTITRLIHGASEALGTAVAQRYDIPQDWLWDACHMAGVNWGSHCKGFCSEKGPHYCFEQSAKNPTINLIHKFGNPSGIPYPSCTAKLSGAYVTQESVSLRIFVSKKGMIRVHPMDVCTRNLRQKAESVLLQETNVFCAWNMGAHVQHTTS